MASTGGEIIIRVLRQNPARGEGPHYQTYEVPRAKGLTILKALMYVRENLDPTLGLRFSCRSAISVEGRCGTCAVLVNSIPRAVCQTFVDSEMTVEPLKVFPVIKDLIYDFRGYEERMSKFVPYLQWKDTIPEDFLMVNPPYYTQYRSARKCINCYVCLNVCPPYLASPESFVGPLGVVKVSQFLFDFRDKGGRVPMLVSEGGLYNCIVCRACNEVCPKGIDISGLVLASRARALQGE